MLRTLGYSAELSQTCGAGFLWVLFNQRKQALHDRIANTVVIDDGPGSSQLEPEQWKWPLTAARHRTLRRALIE